MKRILIFLFFAAGYYLSYEQNNSVFKSVEVSDEQSSSNFFYYNYFTPAPRIHTLKFACGDIELWNSTFSIISNTTKYIREQCMPPSIDRGIEPEMIFVQGGTYQMGCNSGDSDEKPAHSVTVSSFYISKYEITNEDYIKFLNAKNLNSNGSYNAQELIDMNDEDCAIGYRDGSFYFKGSSYADNKKCPVIEVTWYGAVEYCNWLSQTTGKTYRLPTEAEWEYAARGGSLSHGYIYSGSNNINEVAWYEGNSGGKTHSVGTKQPNELGIYDMSGNVCEWCSDWYGKYKRRLQINLQCPPRKKYRVIRGGSWYILASYCRVTHRYYYIPTVSYSIVGFRIVREE
jgi:formylglycine-generating enzyme required for sulfatase activity